MDPHPTPFPGKRRSVAALAKTTVPKPKTIAAARAKTARKSSPAPPQPRPRRAFGTVRSSNAHAGKPPPLQKAPKVSPPTLLKPVKVSPPPAVKPSKVSPPPLLKPVKVSPPPAVKPVKVSPPPAVKPVKVSPPPLLKPVKVSPPPAVKPVKVSPPPLLKPVKVSPPPPVPKPWKLLPPNLARATKPSRQLVKAPKKAAPGPELQPKDAAGHTPMVSVKALEKKVKVVAAETPFFSAQNCSNCSLDSLEESTYWLAHIHQAESVGKHKVAAAFFHLAFECQAQPIHRIQSELRNYTVRHESAGTLAPLFDELLLAHGMPVNQPKFETDGFEMVATPSININVDDKRLDSTTVLADEKCLGCDCSGDLVIVAVPNVVKPLDDEGVDQPSFERKLDDSFEFDDCDAVIVDSLVDGHSDLEKSVHVNGPCDTEIMQSACRSSIDKLSLKGSPAVTGLSERRFSSDSPSDKMSLFAGGMSATARRLSSVSCFDNKSPFGSSSSMRLTSSCPHKKSLSSRVLSTKRISSCSNPDGEHGTYAQAGDLIKVIPHAECDCPNVMHSIN
ncbi:hypothetical protein GUJ93_ZPchr0003g17940 [Zizania palustris]|uniref:Uncharacterized protein n=1 Tax=Zizania palustris TaxID=103762 RepID=A0A8J5S478_ZIZPA|nr:hypothetical protein GUJ93_ZPchr0003g17940 [Zizania palustris]